MCNLCYVEENWGLTLKADVLCESRLLCERGTANISWMEKKKIGGLKTLILPCNGFKHSPTH